MATQSTDVLSARGVDGKRGRGARLIAYLKARPILCLLILTPGIPEYLSGSSALSGLVVSPILFFVFLSLNLALYGPGVLLIREAMVRWKKGWPTVLALGAAYGILEEGIALSTLYNSNASVVGGLGFYGHWLGVNWVWTAGVLLVHMVYSIGLPILLLGLAIPETRGRSLLRWRGVGSAFGVLFLDVLVLLLIVVRGEHFWMGWPILVGSILTILVLVLLARRLPEDAFGRLRVRLGISRGTRWALRGLAAVASILVGILPVRLVRWLAGSRTPGPVRSAVVGGLVFTSVILVQGVGGSVHLPSALDLLLVVAVESAFLLWVVRRLSFPGNERAIIGFALGLLVPIVLFGILSQFPIEVVLIADAALFVFFARLLRAYPAKQTPIESRRQFEIPPHVGNPATSVGPSSNPQ